MQNGSKTLWFSQSLLTFSQRLQRLHTYTGLLFEVACMTTAYLWSLEFDELVCTRKLRWLAVQLCNMNAAVIAGTYWRQFRYSWWPVFYLPFRGKLYLKQAICWSEERTCRLEMVCLSSTWNGRTWPQFSRRYWCERKSWTSLRRQRSWRSCPRKHRDLGRMWRKADHGWLSERLWCLRKQRISAEILKGFRAYKALFFEKSETKPDPYYVCSEYKLKVHEENKVFLNR